MLRKFRGQFNSLTVMGAKYCNQQRFWPLRKNGKPLWEFKEHDHRLYCVRLVNQDRIIAVLLNGWIKDKKGKAKEEAREIQRALNIYAEFTGEFQGGSYDYVLATINNKN